VVERKYRTIGGNDVPMQFYVLEENQSKAAKHLDILERTVQLEEKYLGNIPGSGKRLLFVKRRTSEWSTRR
jgi:aminopeptidase N